MGLCAQRACGCSIDSDTLDITGSGTGADPWHIEIPHTENELPYLSFLDATARDLALPSPAEGQLVFIETLEEDHKYLDAEWVVWNKRDTSFSFAMSADPTPSGFSNGDATQSGRFWISAGTLHVKWQYTLGGSTTWGTTDFTPQFPWPTGYDPPAAAATSRAWDATAWFYDASTGLAFPGIGAAETAIPTVSRAYLLGGYEGDTFGINGSGEPFAWAGGDEINLSIVAPMS